MVRYHELYYFIYIILTRLTCFCLAGASHRWTVDLYTHTLPYVLTILDPFGAIFLPGCDSVLSSLCVNKESLMFRPSVLSLNQWNENPLYMGTGLIDAELGGYTNLNQMANYSP